MLNINDLTYGQIKELKKVFAGSCDTSASNSMPFIVGKPYLIRTVTHINTGRITRICGKFLVLTDAAWIADTGRFSDCVKTGSLDEVEPWPPGKEMFVNADTIIDGVEWMHTLPQEQK